MSYVSTGRVDRREVLRTLGSAGAVAAVLPWLNEGLGAELKGRIKQSVCLWCYGGFMKKNNMSLDQFCAAAAALGLKSVELTGPNEWPTLKKHGLICAMSPSHGIPKGLNRTANHEECLAKIRKSIDDSAAAGFPNVITFSGNREGMDDEEGLKNCIAGLKQVAGYAEQKKVTICLEFLNSIGHKDYMADRTAWCVKLVRGVGSPRVKVLYDIFHAGMMKENVRDDIRQYADCWGHYHTGGLPGRNEIDQTQTLDYTDLMQAVLATGYQGYVGQEFIPKRPEALMSLEHAVKICDV